MARNSCKMAIYESHKFCCFFFLQKVKKGNKQIVFYLVVFDPIKIKTLFAPQNVYHNLSFVKDINIVCKKMTRNCCKIVPKPIYALHFQYVFTLSSLL